MSKEIIPKAKGSNIAMLRYTYYILSDLEVRGYQKCRLSLMFWVSERRLTDQANVIQLDSLMTEAEIEELDGKSTKVLDPCS